MILRFFFILVIIYLLYRVVKGILKISAGKKPEVPYRADGNMIQGGDLVQDPFCRIYIPEKDGYKELINGQTVYFCSKTCSKKYQTAQKKEF